MKKNKGITLIEVLILVAISAIITITIWNAIKGTPKRHRTERITPVQEVKEQVNYTRITITEVGKDGSIIYYIVKDQNPPYCEYLVAKYVDINSAGLAITKMEK